MEGLIFFIAMIFFIVRVMNKIKKAASGGKTPVSTIKKPPLKDKLEELIRNMEEAEKLKKEGKAPDAGKEYFYSEDNKGDDILQGEKKYSLKREAFGSSYESGPAEEIAGSRKVYDTVSAGHETDNLKGSEELDSLRENIAEPEESRAEVKKTIKRQLNGMGKESSIFTGSGITSSNNNRSKKSILSSLSKYSELQRAVVLKEIFDSPVSENNRF